MKSFYLSTLFVFAVCFSFAQCPTSMITTMPATCFGNCDGSITVNTTGGVPPYQVFHPTSGIPTVYTSTIVFNGMCAGTYSIYVLDQMGCPEIQMVTVTEPTQLSVVTTSNDESVPGACDGSITFMAMGGTPGYVYNISPPVAPPYTNLCAGTYTVCAVDMNGCLACDDAVVGNSCAIVTNTDAITDATCFGNCDGSVTISAGGGTAPYTVSGSFPGSPLTFTTQTTITGLCAGSLSLTVEDVNGCTDDHMVVVNQPAQLMITASATNATPGNCDGTATANVTGGTSPTIVSWFECVTNAPMGMGSTITNLCAGDYYAVVQDANGCMATSTCVTVDSTLCSINSSVITQTNATCFGTCDGTVVVQTTGGTPPYMIDAGNGFSGVYTSVITVTDLCAGDYTMITTDVNGCADTLYVTITESPELVAAAGNTDCSAPGVCDGLLTGNATGGAAPYIWNWLDCSTGLSVGTAQNETDLCAGDYQLIVTDINGCADTTMCVNISDSIDQSGIMQNMFVSKIYPNPVSDVLVIETDAPEFYFEIANSLGQVVYVSNPIDFGKTTVSISSAGLSTGLYVVRIFAGDEISAVPLVVRVE